MSESAPITTAADYLVSLVNQLGEVSYADAAKRLNVPIKTIESWATFLEEEGVVDVKYKFTTPYIVKMNGAKAESITDKEFEEKLSTAEIRTRINNLDEEFKKAELQSNLGEFSLLRGTYNRIFAEISSLSRLLIPQLMKHSKEKAQIADKSIKEMESLLERANSYLSQRRFDVALQAYKEVHMQLQNVKKQIQDLHVFVEQKRKQTNKKSEDVNDLLKTAYDYISNSRVENAEIIFSQIEKVYKDLPVEYAHRKEELEQDILKLKKDLSNAADRVYQQRMDEGRRKIDMYLASVGQALKKNQIDLAEQSYQELRRAFSQLPPGFIREKKKFQERMLKYYGEITKIREKDEKQKLEDLSKKIGSYSQVFKQNMGASQIEEASKTYNQIKTLFAQMPTGFLKEKTQIQKQVMDMYEELTIALEEKYAQDFNQKQAQISNLLQQMHSKLSAKSYDEAERLYEQIKQIYNTLPQGFITQKTQIQSQMIQSFEQLVDKTESAEESEIRADTGNIDRALSKVNDMIKKQQWSDADAAFREAEEAYKNMPPGYVAKKTDIREKMFALKRQIIPHLDHSME